jgi:two-component system OmpR family response regulator
VIIFLSRAQGSSQAQERTLIVEDDATSRDAMLRILRMLGFKVEAAATMGEGMEALSREPATMILDLMLPDGNGMEILRRVRTEGLPIRVAVLTGADRPMIEAANRLGPDALFTKPVDLTKLLTWLRAA